MDSHLLSLLKTRGLKPTPNRMLVLKAIAGAGHPVSLIDIEDSVATMYRASIFRVLNLFVSRDVVHTIDDGSGSQKYELCHGAGVHTVEDQHAHFHCESCNRTFCLEDVRVPEVALPQGFSPHSVNYVVKGICPDCNR